MEACANLGGKKEGGNRLCRRSEIAAVGPLDNVLLVSRLSFWMAFFVTAQSAFFSSSPTHGNQSGRQKCRETAHALQAVAEVICWPLQLVLKQLLQFRATYGNMSVRS